MAMNDDVQRVIRTPDQRLRVFVSSTLGELSDERAAARTVIERLRLTPVMFELGARPHPPRALYRTYLQQSHVFVGIYWQSYGWVAPEESVSGIEDEYLLSSGMPRLLYVKDPAPQRQDALAALLRRIQDEDTSTYKRFTTTEQLEQLLADDLMVLLTESFESATSRSRAVLGTVQVVAPPQPITPLLGREPEVEALTALIAGGARLVTLTGSGGIGKTRLALEVGRRLMPSFDEAVHFVSLADLHSPDDVLSEIATSLGVPLDAGRSVLDTLVRNLTPRRLLLVLDNFEHVTAASTEIAALLDRCPSLHVLATSRHLLRLRGEREYRVGPLTLPAAGGSLEEISGSPAVQLFVDRARAVHPTFRLTADNAADVAAICARLDGVPLALELAAARARLLPPAMLLARLSARTDFLATGPVDLPDRQRTLRATIDWSYQLLDEQERSLFDRLSVFAGGFTLDAVEPVCGSETPDVLETLTSLLDKSLVVLSTDLPDAEPRLHMLFAIRDYAAERLEESGDQGRYRQRHADFYLRLVEDYRADLVGAAHAARSERLDAEAGNLRAAVTWWAQCRDTSALGRFAWATFPHYWLRGQLREFDDMLSRVDDTVAVPDREGSLLLTARGLVHIERGRLGPADALADRLLAIPTGDDLSAAAALVLKASTLTARGQGRQAVEYAERAHRAATVAQDAWLTAVAARVHGAASLLSGDLARARADFLECVEYARTAQHWPMLGASLGPLGSIARRCGDVASARTSFIEAAESYRRGRSREGLPFLLEEVAAMTADADPRLAAEILATADAIRDEMGIVVPPQLEAGVNALRDRLHTTLGTDFESAWRFGRGLEAAAALDRAVQVSLGPQPDLTA